MGLFDFLLTTGQKKQQVATKIGLQSGFFVECPVCRDVTEANSGAPVSAETDALIHQLVSQNDPQVSLFHGDEQALHDMVEQVAKQLPYHCTCESI